MDTPEIGFWAIGITTLVFLGILAVDYLSYKWLEYKYIRRKRK